MKLLRTFAILCCVLLFVSSCEQHKTPRSKHVVLIGLDAMSARGVQRAQTPNFNEMIENGAVSVQARCVRPSNSSPNWMSMVTGTIPLMHGILDNGVNPSNSQVTPAVENSQGMFPTIFEVVKTQRPDAKVYMYCEWGGQTRMYDVSQVDKLVGRVPGHEAMAQATEDFIKDKPEFLFVSIGEPDHVGHEAGHESTTYLENISKYDALIGEFVRKVEEAGMLDETVIIITADHGGLGFAHGGDSAAEREIPIILYGGSVTKGKVMERTNLICDIAATVAGLLGVELPQEAVGKFITEAFEPKSDKIYVPIPYLNPHRGMFNEKAAVTITGDVADAEIFYTLDGTVPTDQSMRYEGPIELTQSTVVKAVVYRNGQHGKVEQAMIRVLPEGAEPKVTYKLYDNVMGQSVPDFMTLGAPTRRGYVHEFSLDELNVEDKDHFAAVFTSNLEIDEAGLYKFGIISDDGAKLFIDGKKVIDNDGSHTAEMKYGQVQLEKGWHQVKVEYFEDYMGQKLELYYQSETIPEQVLPFAKLKR